MGQFVFLSYSRADRAYVQRLAAYLAQAGIPVWWDRDLAVGDRFPAEIQDRIDECAAFVVVLSPSAVGSHWVLDELEYAVHQNRPVLPLQLAPCRLPLRAVSLQVLEIRGGAMPGDGFVARLRSASGLPPPSRPEAVRSDDAPTVVSSGQKPDASAVLRFLEGLEQRQSGYRAADVVAGMGALLERISDPDACIGLIPPYFRAVRWPGQGYPRAEVDAFVLGHRPAPADFDHALRLYLADQRLLLPDDVGAFPRWARKGQEATLTYSSHPRALLRIPNGWLAVTDSDLRFRIGGSSVTVPFADLDHLRLDVECREEGWAYDGAAAGSTTMGRLLVSYRGRDVWTGDFNYHASDIQNLVMSRVSYLGRLWRAFATRNANTAPTA
ncbi:toll/interleukin-1 receptor domain-containing protein [Cryptosporangium minutisporangium]